MQKEKEELRREREAREAEIGEFLIDDFCQLYLRKKPFSSGKIKQNETNSDAITYQEIRACALLASS